MKTFRFESGGGLIHLLAVLAVFSFGISDFLQDDPRVVSPSDWSDLWILFILAAVLLFGGMLMLRIRARSRDKFIAELKAEAESRRREQGVGGYY